MDAKKKIMIVGAAALIVVGLIAAANAAVQAGAAAPWKGWGKRGMGLANLTQSLGLPENATRQQIGDAMWEKQITDLGLTDSSTLAEYRAALKAKMQEGQEERMQGVRAKLSLPANATRDDIMDAMKQWRAGNKELLQGAMGGHGIGRGPGMGFGMGGRMGKGIGHPEPGD
jgi:hypothetical protein